MRLIVSDLTIISQSYQCCYKYIKVYKKESRKEWGVNSFKDGEEYYTACLKWHLSVDMTPEEVHEKGLQEVERIYKKMIKVRRDTFRGHFKLHSNALAFVTLYVIG